METKQLGRFQPFVCPPLSLQQKLMGFVCCKSGYGSTTLSVNSRLVHLLAVLIPLTYHVPLFCYATSVFTDSFFVMGNCHIFLVQ